MDLLERWCNRAEEHKKENWVFTEREGIIKRGCRRRVAIDKGAK